eukprot:GHVP01041304.1.p1 GENE.GHVP01041304.1~~GHVP01041304.1.p1  ORF type:complete len:116 (-),score=7.71 GHVP01041304.1:532-879(-)
MILLWLANHLKRLISRTSVSPVHPPKAPLFSTTTKIYIDDIIIHNTDGYGAVEIMNLSINGHNLSTTVPKILYAMPNLDYQGMVIRDDLDYDDMERDQIVRAAVTWQHIIADMEK